MVAELGVLGGNLRSGCWSLVRLGALVIRRPWRKGNEHGSTGEPLRSDRPRCHQHLCMGRGGIVLTVGSQLRPSQPSQRFRDILVIRILSYR